MTKHIKHLALGLSLALVLSACSQAPDQEKNEQEAPVAQTIEKDAPASPDNTPPSDQEAPTSEEAEKLEAMEAAAQSFTATLTDDVPPANALVAYKEMIPHMKPGDLSIEFIKLEKHLIKWSMKYTDRLYSERGIQELIPALNQSVQWPEGILDLDLVDNQDLKDELSEMIDGAIKFVWLEGSPYPIVDYGKLEGLKESLIPPLAAYVELAALESNEVSVHDAGIVIPWNDLSDRLMKAEEVLRDIDGSAILIEEKVRLAYMQYFDFYTLGLSNTPVVDWNSYKVQKEVLDSYHRFMETYPESASAKQLMAYLALLQDHDYKIPYGDQDQFSAFMAKLEALKTAAIEELQSGHTHSHDHDQDHEHENPLEMDLEQPAEDTGGKD